MWRKENVVSEVKVVNENAVKGAREAGRGGGAGARCFFEPLLPVRSWFGMNPFASMREFNREMDRLLSPDAFGMDVKAWVPVVDVQRSNGNLEVTAELPGLRKEEVKGR